MGAKLASLSGVLGATQDRGLSFITSTSFSAVSSVSVDGCFTSSYDNYRILFTFSTSGEYGFRLRAASTDATASSYIYGLMYGGFANGNATGTASFWQILNSGSSPTDIVGDVFSPALAAKTTGQFLANESTVVKHFGGRHDVASAYDGFTAYPVTGTFSGTVWIYGYRRA